MDQLTEPPPSISTQNILKDIEKPGSPLRLPLQRVPKKALSLKKVSPYKYGGRLPPWHALHPATDANTEAGLSCVVITGSPKLISGNDLLALPPIPIDIYQELTSMFGGIDCSNGRDEPGMSDEEATHHKFGRDTL